MAPFSICSKCKARTRKVVKDPVTLEDIYLCPKCCKAAKETPAKENALDKKGARKKQRPANEPKKPTEKSADPKPKPKPKPEPEPAAPAKQPLATVAAAPPPIHNPIRKCTPPVMQTVVINGRKYIAISATATDN